MRTSLNIQNKLTMISEMSSDSTFQVLEYDYLNGGDTIELAFKINELRKSNIKLKQVRILLKDSAVKVEKGVFSYLKGDIEISNKIGGPIELGKKFFSSKLTGETTFKPQYKGTGEIFLEPSFGHYALIELEDDEIIIDNGLFYACEDSIKIKVVLQKNVSSMVLGNEGLFQTKLSGSGIVVLEIPVPESEIFKCKINNDTLKIDGNFAILRTGNIELKVEKATKSLVTSAASGEGFLNVYSGTGEVWLMPTKDIYNKLATNNRIINNIQLGGSSNTKV